MSETRCTAERGHFYNPNGICAYCEDYDEGRDLAVPAVPAQVEPDAMAEQVAMEPVEPCPKCGIGWSKTNSAECPECAPTVAQAGAQQTCLKCGEPVFGIGWHMLNEKWASLDCKDAQRHAAINRIAQAADDSGLYDKVIVPDADGNYPDEPQAGAQDDKRKQFLGTLKDTSPAVLKAVAWYHKCNAERFEAHLATIRAYVLAAQQTPITREDMGDHLKALTVFDEAHGLYNLVLSETGK
jgi:hypothetical protein